jgi:hypothetical protein
MADPVVLLIHGLGLKNSAEDELSMWKTALATNLRDDPDLPPFDTLDIRMAYYSQELHPEVVIGGRAARGAAGEEQQAKLAAYTQVLQDLEGRAAQYDASKRAAHEDQSTSAAREPAEVARRGAAEEQTHQLPLQYLQPGQPYHAFIRDVTKYFALDHRKPVNSVLEARLGEISDRPTLLVSHSLGTVVSYDVLAASETSIDTWITLGSPLGYVQELQGKYRDWLNDLQPETYVKIAEGGARLESAVAWLGNVRNSAVNQIQDFWSKLMPRAAAVPRGYYELPPPRFPEGVVQRWYNVYDPGDPVATGWIAGVPTLANLYRWNDRQRVYDVQLLNPWRERQDAHSIIGYLEALQTAWLVKDFLLRHS